MKYEYPDITTADVAFRAYGRTLGEMLENAGLALVNVTVDVERVQEKVSRTMEAEGKDLESLLYNWLTEIIFYIDSENLVFSRFEVEMDEKNLKLKAKAWGEKIDQEKHRTKTHVKAATYHEMKVEKKNGWMCQVIVDV